jgi:tRNA modification GTPase
MDSIFAPITGSGGAVTVIRLSGANALTVATQLARSLPKLRRAALRQLHHGGEVLDIAIVTAFPAPNSYTGEDCVEFSLHGGRAVRAAVTNALVSLGARPAEPGEFSRRAFLNGRIDLLQAEAIADLIAAETQAQRRLAIDGADSLQAACMTWRETLRHIIAQQEALIDFPDEDLPAHVEAGMLSGITTLRDEMDATLAAAPSAERLREGLEFVILGPPNAGKSTLLNALAGADIAIVSETPGTTRDAISVKLDLAGVPVHITDTAGLRETENSIEAEGIRRTRTRAADADLILSLAAPGQNFAKAPPDIETLRIATKSDAFREELAPAGSALAISAQTGAGMAILLARLSEIAQRLTDTAGAPAPARPRQIACIRDTVEALNGALANTEPELRGEDLRAAASALARLTGSIGVEEILDAVFSGFCIGK